MSGPATAATDTDAGGGLSHGAPSAMHQVIGQFFTGGIKLPCCVCQQRLAGNVPATRCAIGKGSVARYRGPRSTTAGALPADPLQRGDQTTITPKYTFLPRKRRGRCAASSTAIVGAAETETGRIGCIQRRTKSAGLTDNGTMKSTATDGHPRFEPDGQYPDQVRNKNDKTWNP